MCDYENNIFIFTNETKNGKEEANIYQGYNQFLEVQDSKRFQI